MHNLNMATKIIKTIAAGEGIEIDVAAIALGYSVVIHDIDADQYLPAKIYSTMTAAIEYADALAAKM